VTLVFEPNSHLRQIEAHAFSLCKSLKSICIPSSFEELLINCLSGCAIENLTFEPNSKLQRIAVNTFAGFSSLKSICFPASLEISMFQHL
jgi:hypothetical protein